MNESSTLNQPRNQAAGKPPLCGMRQGPAFGFGPLGVLHAEAWYCRTHREEGERLRTDRPDDAGNR